jgi:hypothetical protein
MGGLGAAAILRARYVPESVHAAKPTETSGSLVLQRLDYTKGKTRNIQPNKKVVFSNLLVK